MKNLVLISRKLSSRDNEILHLHCASVQNDIGQEPVIASDAKQSRPFSRVFNQGKVCPLQIALTLRNQWARLCQSQHRNADRNRACVRRRAWERRGLE